MGIFNFSKKKETQYKQSIPSTTVFDDPRYRLSEEEFFSQKDVYSTLSDYQKAAIIVAMSSFQKGFILRNTLAGEYVDSLVRLRGELLSMSTDMACSIIQSPDDIVRGLSSIEEKKPLDYLLKDMKYMLSVLLSLTMRYRDGAEINRKAINSLYGLFMPLGYEKDEIHNPMSHMHVSFSTPRE